MSWISPFTVATIIFPFDTVLLSFFAKLSFIVFKETFTVSADCINWGKNISPLSYFFPTTSKDGIKISSNT